MIELQNIGVKYGDKTVIDNLNLTIKENEFFTLLGASGCGKSTILKLLAGFLNPSKGKILVDGKDVTKLSVEERGIGIVFQNYALFPHLTVFDNVAFGLKVKKLNKVDMVERVNHMLKLVGIAEQANKKPTELSGGQQQRVAVARSLIMSPRILLMDEPLSNLDAKLRIVMRNEIKRLQKELGFTTIFVTHDQEEAMSMSDRIALLNAGNIEQVGAPEELYAQPQTAFVCDFIGESHEVTQEIKTLANIEEHRQMFIRPERISVYHDSIQASNSHQYSFLAKVNDIVYKGMTTGYEIKVGFSNLSCVIPSHMAVKIKPFDMVYAGFDLEDIIVIGESR
ncbi:ABC transporter ATP-binding protein [Photobacterium sp. ZSDE20]|uniref:ABC transporter ATP-binding protein n=1 Tax=Photobacterium pectinilyticum TaxID=2906793 RepID=A0ABT1N029_9GAMM|nr:ABC transporter ATP-binding protein [Photobacterium sp. ZSDE20]MCQ1056634.1 ABC transporter ATP-binding protein [Photobacterium sp. ZSDE20]MDD1820769.1 ABC transporter ATP-binding protein [Photobacterium sp. ZSDE20]